MELSPRKCYVNLYTVAFFIFAGFLLLAIKLIEAPFSISVKAVLIVFICLPFIASSLLFLFVYSDVFQKISINEELLEIKGILRRKKIPWADIESAELSSGWMLLIRTGLKKREFIDLRVFCRWNEMYEVAQVLKSKMPFMAQVPKFRIPSMRDFIT